MSPAAIAHGGLEAEALELAVQGAWIQAQFAGGATPVAVMAPQRVLDQPPFDLVQRQAGEAGDTRGRRPRIPDGGRQVLRLDPAAGTECEGVFERVAQLADVAGVVVVQQQRERLGRRSLHVMHANNETGVLQPITELAALARSRGVLLHVDAVQTAGKLPGRLADLGADLVSLSAHKLHGPKGVGALYVRKGTPLDPLITGGEHERGLRAGTENVAGIVGLAEALALACAAAESEAIRQAELRDRLERDLLAAIPGARVNGAAAPRVPNTTNLAFPGVDGESVVVALDLRGICCSTGSACSTGDPEPSHVLLAMGLDPRDAQSSVRLSLGRETRDEDIATVLHALVEVVGQLRAVSSL